MNQFKNLLTVPFPLYVNIISFINIPFIGTFSSNTTP